MKLRKWLSFFLIAALVISILQRPGIKVSAEENTEDTVSEETNQKITVSENDDSDITTEKSDEENETDENEEDKQLDDEQEETVIPEEKVPQENKIEEEPTGQPEGALKTDQPMTLNALESEANSEKEEIPDEVEEDIDLSLTEEPEPKPQTADIASGTDRAITWVIDADGKLTVNGTGDFSTSTMPWDQYKEQIVSAEVSLSGTTVASEMFWDCSNLVNLDLSNFDTSNVTDMSRMFRDCSNLVNLDLSNFDTTNVTNMEMMFAGCSSLRNCNLSHFDTDNTLNMACMFSNCYSLADLELNSFDTSNVIDMNNMFCYCSSLKNLDLSNFNTSNVKNMGSMFRYCSSLKNLDLSNFNTSNVTDMVFMFEGCSNLVGLNVNSFDTGNVTNMGWMFLNCSSLTDLNVNRFNTSNVTRMTGMFAGCSVLKELNVSNFSTSNVTDMEYMFSECSNLIKLDLHSFDTASVTRMSNMFGECYNLESVNLSSFDTSNVTNMFQMFMNCEKLISLNLSSFDISSVEFVTDMFLGCNNLLEIYVPYNSTVIVSLPSELDTIWLLPDGTEVTELPQNLAYSIVITRHRNPKIITTTTDLNMSDVIRVKYVPYSYTVETNNWDESNKVTYSVVSGELAQGLMLYPATGEIYGVPLEAGEFPIRVKAEFSNPEYLPSYADLTLTVLDNSDNHVFDASDPGYEVEQYIGTQVFASPGSSEYYYVLKENVDQLFVSAGKYEEFIDLWLNGEKLTAGEDYTKESGSTRITIRSQTLANKTDKNGTNTIAAEFRVGGNPDNDLKRTAQNFRIDFQQEDTRSEGNSQSGGRHSGSSRSGGDGASGEESIIANSAIAVVRLIDAAGNPLANTTLELHSTPQIAQTNQNGIAVFGGVPEGVHTLYVKDRNGNILASRSFELLFGDIISLNGEQVIVKAGAAFTFQVQMSGNELKFLNVYGGDIYQVLPANTDDQENIRLWLMLMLISGSVICGTIFYRRRKYRYYEG